MNQFVLFGDSLTQQSFSQERGFAFGAALQDAYVRRLDIVNRGFSGFNTVQALHILEDAIPPPSIARIQFLTIWLGANDARLPDTPGFPQHVPVEQYVANLRKIVSHSRVQAHKEARIILMTPPPVEESMQEHEDRAAFADLKGLRRTAATNAQYAKAVRELAADLKLPCLDIWTAMITQAGHKPGSAWSELPGSKKFGRNEVLAKLQRDGLHFNPAGYRLVYDELMALILRTWPDQDPAKLSFVVPAWDNASAWKGVYP